MLRSAGRLFLIASLAVALAACDDGGGPPPPMVLNTDNFNPEPPPDPNLVPVVGDLGGPVEHDMSSGPRGCQFETPPCNPNVPRENWPENQTGNIIPPGNGRAMPVATQQPPPPPPQSPANALVPLLGAVGLFVPGMMDNSMGGMGGMGGMHGRH